MLPEIQLEALQCFDRTSLEGMQMHSRYLRDLVNRHARALPLRYIHYVEIGYVAYTRLLEDDRYLSHGLPPGQQSREMLFHLVNNAFIHRFLVSFRREDLPHLYYLRANAKDLQCHVRTLRMKASEAGIDYALLDFLAVHLKPRIYEMTTYDASFLQDYTMLFANSALLGNVKHVVYELPVGTAAPDCIIPELFGDDVVETCAITTTIEPRPWICKFIKMFQSAKRGTNVVRSVTLLHKRFYETSPLRHTVEPLGKPQNTNAPTPQSAFIKDWFCNGRPHEITAAESPPAELFVFESTELAQKLEVYVWAVEEAQNNAQNGLHYAFLQEIVDM